LWLYRHYYTCRRKPAIRPFVVNETYRCNQILTGALKVSMWLLRAHLKNTDFPFYSSSRLIQAFRNIEPVKEISFGTALLLWAIQWESKAGSGEEKN